MKKIILLNLLISGLFIQIYSQVNTNIRIDTTFSKLSTYNFQKPLSLTKTIEYKNKLNISLNYKNYSFDIFSNKEIISKQDTIITFEKLQSYDNMPCLNPQGFFPMMICEPDSSIRYSLLIKEMK